MGWGFVGRLGELRFLEAAWLAAGAGRAAPVVVVYGESGIGKTRTVAELARVVRARGAEVLWGACHEGGDAHPYGVWAEAVRGYVERSGGQALASALGGEVRWLAPLLGDVALPGVERVSAPPGVARLRLAEVLVRVLDSFERPPVVTRNSSPPTGHPYCWQQSPGRGPAPFARAPSESNRQGTPPPAAVKIDLAPPVDSG